MEGMRVCWPEMGRATVEAFTVRTPGPGEVLIRTDASLISPGTERAFFLGLPNAQRNYPAYPGYCNLGTVAEVGEGVEELKVGDRVASAGNHASHVVMRTRYCFKVPDGLEPTQAVYFSLGAIALQGVRKSRLELGECTLVLGLGLIGNLALQLARLQGALPVLGLDPDAGRREIALRCGADGAFDPTEEGVRDAVGTAADGRAPSVVIEATGMPEAVTQAFDWCGDMGRVVLLASTRGVTETNFYRDVHKKGLTVLGAHGGKVARDESSPGFWTLREDTRTVLNLLAAGRLQVSPLTSEVFSWRDAPRAYEVLGSWRKDLLGMVLRWSD